MIGDSELQMILDDLGIFFLLGDPVIGDPCLLGGSLSSWGILVFLGILIFSGILVFLGDPRWLEDPDDAIGGPRGIKG